MLLLADAGSLVNSGSLTARTVNADGRTVGGEVQVLGEDVAITGNATIDASGDLGGGQVLIGGDYQGSNPDVLNAFRTQVEAGSVVRADALSIGDGGKVIVWSDECTRFSGAVSAAGGPLGGNGGLVEVSGGYLDFQGQVCTLAPKGTVGTLLLDPTDLIIDHTVDQNVSAAPYFVPTTTPSKLTWATIKTALAGSDVMVMTTGSPASPGETGKITVAADSPDLASSNSLALMAIGDLDINGSITNSGSGALRLQGGGATVVSINAPIALAGGPVNYPSQGYLLIGPGVADVNINANINAGAGELWFVNSAGVITQAPGTTVAAAKLWIWQQMPIGSVVVDLDQPGNDFDTVGLLTLQDSIVRIQDVDELTIGTAGLFSAAGVSAVGGELHITTPNGYILANGLFGDEVVTGYHAIGNVAIAETSAQTGRYEIRISNEPPYSKDPADVENFLGTPGALVAFRPNTDKGSAVLLDFGDRAGDELGYSWNFMILERFNQQSANDYSFVMTQPDGAQVLIDLEEARTSAQQTPGGYSWETGWADTVRELDHVSRYTASLGAMNEDHEDYHSGLYLRNIFFTGHLFPPTEEFVFLRIFDHVEDFPHIRHGERVVALGDELLA
ncbi:MAG: hypothetical protein ACYTF6_15110, partial [Planctomycetota bacterium]